MSEGRKFLFSVVIVVGILSRACPMCAIRRAEGLKDIHACVDLQREVWKFTEPEDIAAPPLLILGNRYGGCVLLAESSDGKAIGFSYALLCSEGDRSLFWWSHMTAVASAHQGKSVGFQLKLAQRREGAVGRYR